MSVRVKICGLKRASDAELAVSLGADLVGVVRAPGSPRRASLEEAAAVFSAVGPVAEKVLVYRDVPLDDAIREAEATGADWVQLRRASDVEIERVERAGFRLLSVYDVREDAHALPTLEPTPEEDRPVLLDVGGGGSGRSFDWSLLGEAPPSFTYVAGGIRPENVEELLARNPYGIDLSSGVEREPGIKDPDRLRSLFEKIGRAR